MKHHPNIFSPLGTALPDRTVGELVAERPGRSRIFQAAGMDFCCQGSRTLREACQRKGLPLDQMIEQLEAELHGNAATDGNPATLPIHELTRYIVRKHHDWLRRELPRLHAMAERVASVYGSHTPELRDIFHVLIGLEAELNSHLAKEEQILFPAIEALSLGEMLSGHLDGPIACMIHEHDDAGAALRALRQLSHEFQPPADACNTYRALFAGLQDLEEDLHRHIHLENSVLFPAGQALAAAAAA